jgi:hypothetical protein
MRTVSIKEYVLEEINRMLEQEGRDLRISVQRPSPRLVTDAGNVIELWPAQTDDSDTNQGNDHDART